MADINSVIDELIEEAEGRYVPVVLAQQIVNQYPALTLDFLNERATAILAEYIADRDRQQRRTERKRARSASVFADFASGDPGRTEGYKFSPFRMFYPNVKGERVEARLLTGKDVHQILLPQAEAAVSQAIAERVFWTRIGLKLGKDDDTKTVGDVIDEDGFNQSFWEVCHGITEAVQA